MLSPCQVLSLRGCVGPSHKMMVRESTMNSPFQLLMLADCVVQWAPHELTVHDGSNMSMPIQVLFLCGCVCASVSLQRGGAPRGIQHVLFSSLVVRRGAAQG